ncbi:MAG: patatin-like phospholipase family protein [Burkholderiaceae bacterium]|nr:patatin-like phospholipase family protein [Burkholderiaceae bacterium]
MANSIRIGAVLSTGGVRGVFAHTGFLQVLASLEVELAAIGGCSAGSFVGGIYASGTPLQQWVETLHGMRPEDFWQPGSWGDAIWGLLATRGHGFVGLSETAAAMSFCRRQLAVERFEQCRIPFHALATSLTTGRKAFFSSGELAPRITASSSIPLLYRPVEIEGEFYCDGGVIDLGPNDSICCQHQLDVLLVHHVAARNRGFPAAQGTGSSSWPVVEILETLLFRTRPWYLADEPITFRNCPCGCRALIVVLEPELPELPWPQTEHGVAIQALAMEQASELLSPYITALLEDPGSLQHLVLPLGVRRMDSHR